jgi:hypothetical protein
MKHIALVVAAAAVFTTLGAFTTLGVANAQNLHKGGSECSSNPYSPNFVPRCGRGAAAKKHNALVKRRHHM